MVNEVLIAERPEISGKSLIDHIRANVARDLLPRYPNAQLEKDQAMIVKKALDASNGGLWHVVIGQSFGASVAHDNNMLLMFRIGKAHFLVFQSFDEPSLVRKEGHSAGRVARPVQEKKGDDDED